MNKKTLIEEIINSRLHQIPIDNNNKFIIKSKMKLMLFKIL